MYVYFRCTHVAELVNFVFVFVSRYIYTSTESCLRKFYRSV